jgi:uncharacterized membrane protein
VPSLPLFLVSVETEFHDRYRKCYGVATKHGTLRQVLEAKRAMTACRRDSLRRRLTAKAPLFLAANAAFTVVTVLLGPRSYGLGYPLAARFRCAWADHRLEQTLDDLEYLTFAAQSMAPETSAVGSSPAASA